MAHRIGKGKKIVFHALYSKSSLTLANFTPLLSIVAKFLVEESPNRDALKSRLCLELYGTLIGMFEKVTSIKFAENYRSAMLVGEVDCAVTILLYQTQALFHTAEVDLKKVKRLYIDCIKQAVRLTWRDYIIIFLNTNYALHTLS